MKLVSIIVPVYNRENLIRDCYNSLIKQTYKDIEIIFVDDGSSDNSLNIMNSFSDKRVKIISQENSGPMGARMRGFKESVGEYICFVDSDDRIDFDYIEKLVNSIVSTGSNMAIGRIGVHTYYPLVRGITLKAKKKPKMIDIKKNREYLPTISPGMVGKLFKRELFNIRMVEFKANEDIVVMYPMYIKCGLISFVNDSVYHYYLAKNSQFMRYLLGYKFDNLYNTFEPLRLIYKEYEDNDLLEDYFYELEMLFIKNISERICNIIDSVDDKIYRYKFISVILDYLECYFPDWDKNPYYNRGYKLGEVSDRYRIRRAYNEIGKIKRNKLYMDLNSVYEKYKKIEKMYEKVKK